MEEAGPSRILVVDDDERVGRHISELLQRAGYRVDLAADGQRALRLVEECRPDLVVLDVVMPGMGGLEVLRILKSPQDQNFLPVILLTGESDMDSRLLGLKLGADDYLTKPADAKEVLARIETLLRIKRLHDQVAGSRGDLEDASLIDTVTGLYNDRYLKTRLCDEFERAERYNEPLSYQALVIEDFEDLRRELGQARINKIVLEVAAIIHACVREFDEVVRSADNRFVILLPRTHFTGSMAISGRIWKAVRASRLNWTGRAKQLEVTFGVAFYPDRDVATAEQLTHKVEQAVSRAREQGPGRICLFQQTAYFFQPD